MTFYTKYRPDFFEGFDPIEFEFSTLDELLAHEDVIHWKDDVFIRYGIADPEKDRYRVPGLYTSLLFVKVHQKGREANWIAAYLSDDDVSKLTDLQKELTERNKLLEITDS